MKLNDIKGLGDKRIEMLSKAGIYSPYDLVMFFPEKYIDLDNEQRICDLTDGNYIAFIAALKDKPKQVFVKKGLRFVKAKFISLHGQEFTATWFNQPFIFKLLTSCDKFIIHGKAKKFHSSLEITAPSIVKYMGQGGVMPVYRNLKGVPSSVIVESIKKILQSVKITGYFDGFIESKFSLMPMSEAVQCAHLPANIDSAGRAMESFEILRLSYLMCAFFIVKSHNLNARIFKYDESKLPLLYENMQKILPFSFTSGQNTAIGEILTSLNSFDKMNRLLQGDVGSGKTVVAFTAMYYAYLSGYQSVLMAPTEILARQHYINAATLFDRLEGAGVTNIPKIQFLSGSQSKIQKDTALFNIKNGIADFIIGTHSVISENVNFQKLSLIVIDEQHRFGVIQRAELENKSAGSDVLVMSATPIPRTLALTVYGDLEQSVIDTVPNKKAKIKTAFVPEKKVDDMLKYIKEDALKGNGTFIVCPRIEFEEENDSLVSAQSLYKKLKGEFEDVGIALIHSKISEKLKSEIMTDFAGGRVNVLIATTVVEVGIDVKNAVNMVIFNAERYGLSQLHQLRGRVGRGEKDSYCFVLSSAETDEALSRIDFFTKCSDGFKLAEFDFSMRGAGDFLGTRQHGGSNKVTLEILEKAREVSDYAKNIPSVVSEIAENLKKGENEYIKSLTLN